MPCSATLIESDIVNVWIAPFVALYGIRPLFPCIAVTEPVLRMTPPPCITSSAARAM
jgi:hypothetical protein